MVFAFLQYFRSIVFVTLTIAVLIAFWKWKRKQVLKFRKLNYGILKFLEKSLFDTKKANQMSNAVYLSLVLCLPSIAEQLLANGLHTMNSIKSPNERYTLEVHDLSTICKRLELRLSTTYLKLNRYYRTDIHVNQTVT